MFLRPIGQNSNADHRSGALSGSRAVINGVKRPQSGGRRLIHFPFLLQLLSIT